MATFSRRSATQTIARKLERPPDLEAGQPQSLFEIIGFVGAGLRYATSPDGERFIFSSTLDAGGDSEILVVLNWPELIAKNDP